MSQSTVLSNLGQLPRELRDEVYEMSVNIDKNLKLPKQFEGSILDHFASQLPHSLRCDKQTTDEASMAILRVALRNLESITAPNPESICLPSMADKTWDAVRQLELTAMQRYYAIAPEPHVKTTIPSIKQIVARCPKLEYLTISIAESMIIAAPSPCDIDKRLQECSQNSTTSSLTPPNSIDIFDHSDIQPESNTHDLFQVYDHPTITELTLNVVNIVTRWQDGSHDHYKRVVPFVDAFNTEGVRRGRNIKLSLDLSPGRKNDGRNGELVTHVEKGVTWIWKYDWFG